MEGSMEEGLRLALRQIRDNRAEYGSEEDWASQVGALEWALEALAAIKEWQGAKRDLDKGISGKGDIAGTLKRLELAEAALMKL